MSRDGQHPRGQHPQSRRVPWVVAQTLRCREREGKPIPDEHTPGGHRRYDLGKLRPEMVRAEDTVHRQTIAYACVSSHDQ